MAAQAYVVTYTASGAGLASFTFPTSGFIKTLFSSATQTSAAVVSVSGQTAPSSGILGADRTIIGFFGQNSMTVVGLNFQIDAGQTVYIDVKVASTFGFVVSDG